MSAAVGQTHGFDASDAVSLGVAISRWPIVTRAQLVRAFRPGSPPASQAPFRTLRTHGWVTAGVSVVTRRDGRAAGRVSVFSVLNLDAARLARDGHHTAAAALARAAKKHEASAAFEGLRGLLSGHSPSAVAAAVEGKTREEAWPDLYVQLRALPPHAGPSPALTKVMGWMAGTVAELGDKTLVLVDSHGSRTAIPRWLARSAHRDRLGDCLVIAQDRLDAGQMLVDALPGLAPAPAKRRTPYGRHTDLRQISAEDAARIEGRPAPLRVLVPVTIER